MKPWVPIYWLFFLLNLLALFQTTQAHVTRNTGAELSSTVAEIWIEADHIKLQLEIGDQDREAFATLLHDDSSKKDDVHQGLVLTGDDGMPLVGEIKVMERRPRTDRSTSLQPADEQVQGSSVVTHAERVYALSERPETLTLTPPQNADGKVSANIGFIVYHQAIPVIDFQYLKAPETLRLDWSDPWYSAFDNANLQRSHHAPLMTFLYVEPYEVRLEILIRLKELASWIPLVLRTANGASVESTEIIGLEALKPLMDFCRRVVGIPNCMEIDTAEQTRLPKPIGEFFLQRSQVHIDGQRSRPMLDRVQFVKLTQQGVQPLETAERLTLHTAMVGVILAYATPGPPQEVTVDWALFNDRITSVPFTVIDPVSRLSYDVTPAQPTLKWTNTFANYDYQVSTIEAIAAQAEAQLDVPLPSGLLCLAALLLFGFGRRLALNGTYRMAAITLILVAAVVLWPFGRIALRNPFVAPYRLPEAETIPILQGLLQNTYRAFDFRAEDDVYDKLAVSVTGDLITDIYIQSRKRLELDSQGGARAKVQDVQLLDVTPIGLPGAHQRLTFQCAWRVAGSVEHWGHTHRRRNQYEALITIQPIDRSWKIVALNLIDERRLP